MNYYEELLQTPDILSRVISERPPLISSTGRIVFCGCGTSFYLGAQVANICNQHGIIADAADAVDVVDGRFAALPGDVFAFISRSGNSTETILAHDIVRGMGVGTYYIGCTGASKLRNLCERRAVIEYAAEENVLESYSFTAQLVLACICAGLPVSAEIPKVTERALLLSEKAYSDYIKGRRLTRLISLYSPFYRPLMREMMLKDGEITQLPAEAWGALEFRHGPRSWADETTLIHLTTGLLTETWERNVAGELLSYGCPVIFYGNEPPAGARGAGHLPEKYSPEDVLYNAVFHIGVACLIGQSLSTKPEKLRNIIYNVEVL